MERTAGWGCNLLEIAALEQLHERKQLQEGLNSTTWELAAWHWTNRVELQAGRKGCSSADLAAPEGTHFQLIRGTHDKRGWSPEELHVQLLSQSS